MYRLLIAILVVTLSSSGAFATQCRDSSGKFMKCPPPQTSKTAHCRNQQTGQYAKCGTPGAKPD
jgi:hypothetical protein